MDGRQTVNSTSSFSGWWTAIVRRFSSSPPRPPALPSSDTNSTEPAKSRNKTKYVHNVTASLSLPEQSIDAINRRQRAAPLTSYALINDSIDWVTAYFPTLRNQPQKIVYEFVIEDPDNPITDIITSLESRIQKSTDAKQIDEFNRQKAILLKENIKEHAYRRVELFFYLLIAVWKINITITKRGGATDQHGTGSKERGTAACHSFPFTNLEFTPLAASPDWLGRTSLPPTLEGTHFIEAMNATMELPVCVNQFDKHFEGMYGPSNRMKAAIELLNQCAKGDITPLEGITRYFIIMDDFFKHFHEKYVRKGTKIDNPTAMEKIWEYEQDGTFNATFNQGTLLPSDEFLAMTLGMSTNEVKLARLSPLLFHKHYHRIQDEIYQSKPVEVERIRKNSSKN